MAWCKTDVSDFFGWNFFFFKSAWIFACAFQFSRGLVQILNFSPVFFPLFALLFNFFLLTRKTYCRFQPPNNACQIRWFDTGFDIFPSLDNPSWTAVFLKLIETSFCKLLLWFVIKLCLKRSSISRSPRWMAWKRTCMPRGQILIHTQNFPASGTLAFVAQSVRHKVVEILLVRFAGSTLTKTLLHLTTRLGRLLVFPFIADYF